MISHPQGVLQQPVREDDHSLGPAGAPVTLVEYGDYQCPHCARAHPRVTAVRERLGDKLRFVFRNFPLTEMHPEALHAAEAAESVAAHAGAGAYWAMHDLLFEHQQDSEWALDDEHLLEYAASAGAEAGLVKADLEGAVFEAHVRTDFLSGVRSGVNGTPTFFINGERFDGDWSNVSSFAAVLEAAAARSHTLTEESRA